MLQNQQLLSNSKVKKVFSRKELVQWISKESNNQQKNIANSFNQNSLKNGVFFLSILQRVFPQDLTLIRTKMKQKPITEYDFEKNLSLAKKILEKHNLQYNLEVNEIVKNKGCFEFLNWIKNLNDGLINISDQQTYSSLNGSEKVSPQKKLLNTTIFGFKTNRQGSSAKTGQKNASQAKSSRNFSASKSENPFHKLKSGKNFVQIGNKQISTINNHSHVTGQNQKEKLKNSIYMSEFDSLDDCNEALYEMALQENIETFRKILSKVKDKASEVSQGQQFDEYLEKVYETIFGKS